MTDEGRRRLCRIIEETLMLPASMTIGGGTRIRDLGADTMDLSEIVTRAQDAFDVTLEEDAQFTTVDDLAALITEKQPSV